jgi:hypothetical protein
MPDKYFIPLTWFRYVTGNLEDSGCGNEQRGDHCREMAAFHIVREKVRYFSN